MNAFLFGEEVDCLNFYFAYWYIRTCSYSQELPSRAVKEILKAADENHDGMISLQEIEHLLDHIDKQNRMSDAEVREILNDLGANDRDMVPVETIKDLLSSK